MNRWLRSLMMCLLGLAVTSPEVMAQRGGGPRGFSGGGGQPRTQGSFSQGGMSGGAAFGRVNQGGPTLSGFSGRASGQTLSGFSGRSGGPTLNSLNGRSGGPTLSGISGRTGGSTLSSLSGRSGGPTLSGLKSKSGGSTLSGQSGKSGGTTLSGLGGKSSGPTLSSLSGKSSGSSSSGKSGSSLSSKSREPTLGSLSGKSGSVSSSGLNGKSSGSSGSGKSGGSLSSKSREPTLGSLSGKLSSLSSGKLKALSQSQQGHLSQSQQGQLAQARQQAKRNKQNARRPTGLTTSKANQSPATKTAGNGLTPSQLTTLQQARDKSKSPEVKRVIGKALTHQALTDSDRSLLLTQMGNNSALNSAIGSVLAADSQRQQLGQIASNLAGNADNAIPLDPGADGYPSVGIDPQYPAVAFPTDANDPTGSGMVMAVEPGPTNAEATALADASIDPRTIVQETSVWQTTRFVRIANASNGQMTVYLQYRTQDDKGEWLWRPGKPGAEEVLSYDLEPGAVVDLLDNDWRINASRVRIWAKKPNNQEWVEFRDKDLWLVRETGDEDEHGYYAPEIQIADVAVR